MPKLRTQLPGVEAELQIETNPTAGTVITTRGQIRILKYSNTIFELCLEFDYFTRHFGFEYVCLLLFECSHNLNYLKSVFDFR